MNRIVLQLVLVTAALICSPLIANAQAGNTCQWEAYCYAYGYAQGGTVYGISAIDTEGNWAYVSAQTDIMDQYNYSYAWSGWYGGWGWAWASISEWVPDGWYYIYGYHTYDAPWWEWDADSWTDWIPVGNLIPTSEISDAIDWRYENGDGTTGGRFHAKLQDANGDPPQGKYEGRKVYESLGSTQDNCVFSASRYGPYPNATEESYWTIGGANGYGLDYIGVDSNWAAYYQWVMSVQSPPPYTTCYVNVPQTMKIDSVAGAKEEYWTQDTINRIDSNKMEATRGNVSIVGEIPPYQP